MNKLVTLINWVNDTDPAINDTHLNQMDSELDAIDDRVIAMETDVITQAENAEAWAVGERGGQPVGNTDPTYHNNSKHYADEAANSASDAANSETNAGLSETAAAGSASDAEADALKSEGFAVGEQNGVPVSSGSPYFENNAKFYAQQAGSTALSALSDVSISSPQNGQTLKYNSVSQKWENGSGGGSTAADISIDTTNTSIPNTCTDVQDFLEWAYPPSVTVTLTLNGAKEDSITIKDSNDQTVGSCIFASGQTSGTCTIDVPVGGGSYKFISSVAKDTTLGTSDYEKTVTLSDQATQIVNVYPDNVMYWYGNFVNAEMGTRIDNQFSVTLNESHGITLNTNSISCVHVAGYQNVIVSNNTFDFSALTNVKTICSQSSAVTHNLTLDASTTRTNEPLTGGQRITQPSTAITQSLVSMPITGTDLTGSKYAMVEMYSDGTGTRTFDIWALWFE